MKSEDVIFENVMQKLQEYKKNKKQKTGRVLSGVATIVILISILFPIIYTFNNNKTNSVENSNSASKNFSNPLQNSIDKSIGLGAVSEYRTIGISYEELIVEINKHEGFKLLIPKNNEKITSISNNLHIELNKTHWFDVLSNTKNSYWNIRYYTFGIEEVHSYYSDNFLHEEVEFNGVKGYVSCNQYILKGVVMFVFDFGDGTGVELRYNGKYNEIIEPETVLKEIFY